MKKVKAMTAILLAASMMTTLAACGSTQAPAETAEAPAAEEVVEEVAEEATEEVAEEAAEETTEEVAEEPAAEEVSMDPVVGDSSIGYKTVTEGFDWGPAITKVILNVGATVDASQLSTDTFSVSSERIYVGVTDYATFAMGPINAIVPRTVTEAYVSDAEGNADEAGTYVTLSMVVGPDNSEGSPYNYDFTTGFNSFVDTTYVITLADGKTLADVDGNDIEVGTIGSANNEGNINPIADDFDLTGKYTDAESGIELTYASYVPAGATGEGTTPLIIWLHGAGEGGTNPIIAIMGNKAVNLATEDIQKYFGETGAEVLAPQTPTMWLNGGDGNYMDPTDASSGYSMYTEALKGLIDAYVESHPEVDANRIYIGGCSNGGYMTVNMLANYPGYFAAAYPVCEAFANNWMDDEELANVAQTPVWLTAAKTDGTVPIFVGETAADMMHYYPTLDESGEATPIDDYSNALYQRLSDAGADVHYSLFENVVDTTGNYKNAEGNAYEYMGHWSWIYTLNNECEENGVTIFEWMAGQSK